MLSYRSNFYNRKTNLEDDRAKRSNCLIAAREDKRFEILNKRRTGWNELDVEITTEKGKKFPKKSRAQRLLEWKEAKAKELEDLKKKQKPIFKVGVVHYNASGTLPLTNITNKKLGNKAKEKQQKKTNVSPSHDMENNYQGRITRQRAKLAKAVTQNNKSNKSVNKVNLETYLKTVVDNKIVPVLNHVFKAPKCVKDLPYDLRVTFPQSPKITKSARKSKLKVKLSIDEKNNLPALFSPFVSKYSKMDKTTTQKTVLEVKETEKSGDEVKETEESVENVKETENSVNEVKETAKAVEEEKQNTTPNKMDFSLLVFSPFVNKCRGSDGRRSEKLDPELDIETKEEMETKSRVYSFQKMLDAEIKELTEKCETWKKIVEEETDNIPETVQGDINSVIGKTKMLTSDKFKQFQDLINQFNNNDPMIKINDLQGFWEWMLIDIERMHQEFHSLQLLKEKNWEKVQDKPAPAVVKKQQTKVVVNKPKGVSNIRAHILAAKKYFLQKAKETVTETETKIFDGNFFKIESPVSNKKLKEPKPITPRRVSTLREDVLRTQIVQGITIMSATNSAKRLTPQKVSQLHISVSPNVDYVNMNLTPAKSILKTHFSAKSEKKQVNFSSEKVEHFGISEKYLKKQSFSSDTSMDETCSSPVHLLNNLSLSGKKKRNSDYITPTRRSSRLAAKYDSTSRSGRKLNFV